MIAVTVLLRTAPSKTRIGRPIGRAVHYVRVAVGQKAVVNTRQEYQRLTQGKRALRADGVDETGPSIKSVKARELRPICRLPVEEQVGTIDTTGVSSAKYEKSRWGFGAFPSGMRSLPALRAKRLRSEDLGSKKVEVNSTGAHLVCLRDAVQEKVAALLVFGRFVERRLLDKDTQPTPRTVDCEGQSEHSGSVWAAVHATHVKGVQVAFGS